MRTIPDYDVKVYSNNDELPEEAAELFARQLADSRKLLPSDRPDRDEWRFALI